MSGRAGPTRVSAQSVAQLAAEGLGRNAVARHLGVSRRAVDDAAREAGITWDRSATAAATAARMADVRADLAETFSDAADLAGERLLQALGDPAIDHQVVRALAQVAGISADKLLVLGDRVQHVDDHGESLLARLSSGIGEWAEHLANQPPETDRPT